MSDLREQLKKLQEIKNDPVQLSNLHLELASDYAFVSLDWEDLVPRIIAVKSALMKTHDSVAKADQAYDLTDEGKAEQVIKIRLKALEKLLSGVKRRIETFEREAQNQF